MRFERMTVAIRDSTLSAIHTAVMFDAPAVGRSYRVTRKMHREDL
jgi:hypothetical protein